MVQKKYLALVYGLWDTSINSVFLPIYRKNKYNYKNFCDIEAANSKKGKSAKTYFQVKEIFGNLATFLTIKLITGRTHQIRMHTQYFNHPIIGDWTYGNYQINTIFKKMGLKRLFLHASKLSFLHPNTKKKICISAPIDQSFNKGLAYLRRNKKCYTSTI